MKKIFLYISILFVIVVLNSCIEEDPNLVNPKTRVGDMYIRFVNLAGDKKIRTLNLQNKSQLQDIAYANSSKIINPPVDSLFASVLNGTTTEYSDPAKTKFITTSYFSFIALPSSAYLSNSKNVDSLLIVSTTIGLTKTPNYANIRFLNAYPDSTVTFSLARGCPNGTAIASDIGYKSLSTQTTTLAGVSGVSLIKNVGTTYSVIGLYSITLVENMQYTIIVYKDNTGNPALLLLDEFNTATTALSVPSPITNTQTFVRVANCSDQTVSVLKAPSESIATASPKYISSFQAISACNSDTPDTINAYVNSKIVSQYSLSLEVLDSSSVIVIDTTGTSTGEMIIVAQPAKVSKQSGKAIIRVVNAAINEGTLRVSLGARNNTSQTNGYLSGEIIGNDVTFGSVSSPEFIDAGEIPVSVFTSTQPMNLKYCTYATIEAGKNYLFVISKDANGNYQTALLDESSQNTSIQYLDQAVFSTFVNLHQGMDYIPITEGTLLTNSHLYYTYSLSTILKSGTNTIYINTNNYSFDAKINENALTLILGSDNNYSYLTFSSPSMGAKSSSNYMYRFINASSDVTSLNVRLNSSTGDMKAFQLPYGNATTPATATIEKNVSYMFFDANDASSSVLFTLENLPISYGKNYTIIFAGSKTKGYVAYVQQEY